MWDYVNIAPTKALRGFLQPSRRKVPSLLAVLALATASFLRPPDDIFCSVYRAGFLVYMGIMESKMETTRGGLYGGSGKENGNYYSRV